MPTISFTTTFDLTATPKQIIFTDTTVWGAIPLADVNGNFTVTSPSGIVIYNNTAITNPLCDIDIVTSLISTKLITLPLGTDGFPESGNYIIVYRVWNSALNVYYTTTNTVNYQYVQPKVCIIQRIDCLSPLFSSVDSTDYVVGGITPTISGTHTLDYPYGSAGEITPIILPFTATASVIATSTFYQGTQTTELVAGLVYNFVTGVNAFIIIDSISGSKEVKVDCAYICSILCCVRTFDKLKESYRGVNDTLFGKYDEIFHEIMSYVGLMQFSINCGLGDEVCDYLQKIKTLSNCSDACKCDSEKASRVIGLGYLVGPKGEQGDQGDQGAVGNNGNYITVTAYSDPTCTGYELKLYNGITNELISTNIICNGTAGQAGETGAAGTNAFKFVKQFVTADIEATLTITHTDLIQCLPIPEGCPDTVSMPPTLPDSLIDFHLQVWLLLGVGLGASWRLLAQSSLTAYNDYQVDVNSGTGLITIILGNSLGVYRVVILA